MNITIDDIYLIADHISHSIDSWLERYTKYGSHLTVDDYILTNVATDLRWKYSRYQVEEAFEDRRIKLLLDFYVTSEDYESFNTVH